MIQERAEDQKWSRKKRGVTVTVWSFHSDTVVNVHAFVTRVCHES